MAAKKNNNQSNTTEKILNTTLKLLEIFLYGMEVFLVFSSCLLGILDLCLL
jgi:hypothetical protein